MRRLYDSEVRATRQQEYQFNSFTFTRTLLQYQRIAHYCYPVEMGELEQRAPKRIEAVCTVLSVPYLDRVDETRHGSCSEVINKQLFWLEACNTTKHGEFV